MTYVTTTQPSATTVTTNGKAPRTSNLVLLAPEQCKLIKDESHPLYDPRVNEKYDENMVLNFMMYGVLEPIITRKSGDEYEVIAGRRRVINALEANKRLKKEGKAPLMLKATVAGGDTDTHHFGILVSENEHREDDTPLGKAKKLKKLLDMNGGDVEAAKVTFGLSASTIRNYLSLLDCVPAVQKAVASGKVGATLAAQELSKLPREEQAAALEKLLEAGPAKGAAAKANAKSLRAGKEPAAKKQKCRPAKEVAAAIRKIRKSVDSKNGLAIVAAMKWCLGSDSALNDYKEVEAVLYPEEPEEKE